MAIFTNRALSNIKETGNIWGISKECWINRKFQIGRLSIAIEWRKGSSFMGRFGGGWQWKLGFQASRWSSVILNLLVMSVWFRWETKR